MLNSIQIKNDIEEKIFWSHFLKILIIVKEDIDKIFVLKTKLKNVKDCWSNYVQRRNSREIILTIFL